MSYTTEWNYKHIEKEILSLLTKTDTEEGYNFVLKTIGHLEHSIFQTPDAKTVFRVFDGYFNKYRAIPDRNITLTALERAKLSLKDESYVDDIFSLKLDHKKIKYINDEIPNFIRRDKLYKAIYESAKIIDKGNPEDFDKVKQLIDEASRYTIDEKYGLHYIEDAVYVINDLSQTRSVIKSFSEGINHHLQYGGYTKEELYCYLGASGAGKSIFLVQEGIAACRQGKNVLHVSFELSDTKTLERYYKSMLQMSHDQLIQTGGESVKKLLSGQRLVGTPEMAGMGQIRVITMPSFSVNSLGLARLVERLMVNFDYRVDLLLIDYADLMNPITKTGKKYDDQGRVMAENRSIAQEFKNTCLGATQATRSAINSSEMGQEHTADSIDKVRPLDGLWGIINTTKHKQLGHVDVRFLKNRNGEEGVVVRLMIDYIRMTIRDRPEFIQHLKSGKTWDTFKDVLDSDMEDVLEARKENREGSDFDNSQAQGDYNKERMKEAKQNAENFLDEILDETMGNPEETEAMNRKANET